MIDIELLETLSGTLGVKGRVVKADIRDMAWLWEETLGEAKFADPRLAFHMLRAIARSYLRGRSLRMGNYHGFLRYQWTEALLITVLVKYVSDDPVFERLHQVGVTSVASFASALSGYFDIVEEANKILREGGNHERG